MATSRNYLMTYNNPDCDVEDFLSKIHNKLNATYTCG